MSDDLSRLRAHVSSRPGDPVGHAELAAALRAVGATAESDVARARSRELIRGCMHIGITGPALAAAERLFAAFGGVDDTILLAEVNAARQDPEHIDRARRLVEAVLEEQPELVPARLSASALALGAGDPGAARRLIEPVAHRSEKTRALYVQALMIEGRPKEAFDEARAGTLAHPEAPELWELYGAAALEAGRVDTAVRAFSEVLRLAPERPAVHYNLALAFAHAGSPGTALGVADAGLELRAKDPALAALRDALVKILT